MLIIPNKIHNIVVNNFFAWDSLDYIFILSSLDLR